MDNKIYKYQILEFMNTKPEYGYTYDQLADNIRLPRHQGKILKMTLQEMIREGSIHLKNREYRLAGAKATEEKTTQAETIVEGRFDATSLAKNLSYAFVITDDGDYFISSEDTLNAYHGDMVRVEIKYGRQNKQYGIIREVIKRAREQFVGNIAEYQGKVIFVNDNRKIPSYFEISDQGKAKVGQKVIMSITNWGNRAVNKVPVGKVIEVLGMAGNPDIEMLGIMKQFDLPLEFPEEVINAANALSLEISDEDIAKRHDYRNILTFTIDPISAKDYDDAISLEITDNGYKLYVHIADVAHYVKTGSPLFQEALNRGNSYYFPKKVIPMLPEQVSNKLCSLRPDEDKLTMSVITHMDKQGRISKQEICESIIKSDSRLNYEEVDKLFAGEKNNIPQPVQDILHEMRILSKVLSEKRRKQGYLFFDLPETEYIYDEEGLIHRLDLSFETESHTLIENFMLIANEYVAWQLSEKSKITMYRIHEFPDGEKIDKLEALSEYYGLTFVRHETMNKTLQDFLLSLPSEDYHKVFDKIVLRSMKKAKYSTKHLPHFGLAMETYTHFTSPIRRLCDLVIHHLLKTVILHTERTDFTTKEMETMSTIASDKELIADQSEREVERFIITEFMKKNLGEEFTGIVTGLNNTNIFIHLDQIPISGILPTATLKGDSFNVDDQFLRIMGDSTGIFLQLVDRVKVQVSQVTDDVYLTLKEVITVHDSEYHGRNVNDENFRSKDKFKARSKHKSFKSGNRGRKR
jgi:ribonuclease R